jgi:endonuclease/exonuclease/phosphatase family metal-dependent hydrolase
MQFKILNWNIGGAKFLEEERDKRKVTREMTNKSLASLIKKFDPDVVTLQEIVQYQEDGHEKFDLIDEIGGYMYFPTILIDTKLVSSKAKWRKLYRNNKWRKDTYFGQGNAYLLKEGSPAFPVWDLSNLDQKSQIDRDKPFVEHVHLDSGLYFGDRNTEPRAALVMHLIYDPSSQGTNESVAARPLDIFVVNVHLTTLMKEREGVPEIDIQASELRLGQLDIVFNGIVSRYNSWRRDGYPERTKSREPAETETFKRHSPVWILAGDFNFTEESDEYMYIKKRYFIDSVPDAGRKTLHGVGTKAKGARNNPTLTLDYVFAGPKFVSLDPVIEEVGLGQNRVIHDHEFRCSDHYPVMSTIDFTPRLEEDPS